MKILFVIDTLGPGGKERRLTELLKALKSDEGVESELAIMSDDVHYHEVYLFAGKVHKVIRSSTKDLSCFVSFYRLIRDTKPDIVHIWDSMTAVYVAPACRLLNRILVNGMVIDAPVEGRLINKHWLRARITFPFSTVVVGNSQAGLRAYNVSRRKGVVIHNGFDFSRIENLETTHKVREEHAIKTKYLIGMVATFWSKKDYPTFFRAAQLLIKIRDDVTFMAIGANTDESESISLIDKENYDKFRLLGKQSDVEKLVNAMDICVLSTFTEGISNSILEYMALGKPVIATRGGGTEEIVMDNTTGFLVTQSNPEELKSRMDLLLNDASLREKMGLAGQSRVEDFFSISLMVNKFKRLYADLLADK